MDLNDRLKELRTIHALTLKSLAGRTNLSVSYLSDIERGRTNPSLGTLETLAAAFDMTVIDLLTGVDFAGEQTESSLPPGLVALLDDNEYRKQITTDWVAMLSKIQLRGKRPQTKQDWLELYLHLKRILER